MNPFKAHSIDSAPEPSKAMLEESVKGFGMLPNLHGVMAESPAMLEAYKNIHEVFATKTGFNADELTVVWQTVNVDNECHYCIPAHTGVANMMNVDPAITEALRNKTALPNEKLEALRNITLSIAQDKGNVSEEKLQAFFDAGYTPKNYLDVLVGYAQKVMSNYTNYVAKTEIDTPFQKFAWNNKQTISA